MLVPKVDLNFAFSFSFVCSILYLRINVHTALGQKQFNEGQSRTDNTICMLQVSMMEHMDNATQRKDNLAQAIKWFSWLLNGNDKVGTRSMRHLQQS